MKYKNNKRPIFGVIAAQAADMEQHQILNGIIEQAQNFNIDIAVFTNIYNPNEPNPSLYSENEIYDLILSPELDGIIFLNPDRYNENNPDAGWETADEYLSGNVRDNCLLYTSPSPRDTR